MICDSAPMARVHYSFPELAKLSYLLGVVHNTDMLIPPDTSYHHLIAYHDAPMTNIITYQTWVEPPWNNLSHSGNLSLKDVS